MFFPKNSLARTVLQEQIGKNSSARLKGNYMSTSPDKPEINLLLSFLGVSKRSQFLSGQVGK
jgi:hypothetical protein